MRNLQKLPKPQVLTNNETAWLAEYLADPDNKTKKFRYRESSIKAQLKAETHNKCIYCESKIGHNTPGDIEHKIPTSKDKTKRFDWNNLTIACTECNRRKNAYYEVGAEFIDPYSDDVEAILEHHGPIVLWETGNVRAEISVRKLDLNTTERIELFVRKLGKLDELTHILERLNSETDISLIGLLNHQVNEMAGISAEYSSMVSSVLRSKGII